MRPYITSQYFLFPAALFLAKAVWGAIITTHTKSDCLNHSWKNNFSTLIRARRVPLLQRDCWNGNSEVESDRGERQEAFRGMKMRQKQFYFDGVFEYEMNPSLF